MVRLKEEPLDLLLPLSTLFFAESRERYFRNLVEIFQGLRGCSTSGELSKRALQYFNRLFFVGTALGHHAPMPSRL